jgi:ferric-dicitrate binding protein FerR (iron transport regulator)
MSDDRLDLERLDRFVRRQGTPAELAELERWVNADPSRRALADAMRTVGSREPSAWNAQRALRKLERGRGEPPRRANAPGRHGTRIRQALREESRAVAVQRTLRVAGAAAVVAFAVYSYRHPPAPTIQPPPPPREVVTAPGQRATIDLPDGSRVILSSESHLRISTDTRGPRETWLEGEAFFAVRHDSTRPFLVHTPQGSAEDLGTEFVVNTYPEVKGMRLAVRQGRVRVRDQNLAAGDVALVLESGRVTVVHRQDLSALFAASEGTLVLKSVTLTDAIPRLERWFGVRIRVPNRALLTRRISGQFRTETATESLGIIAIALNCRAEWHQNQVTLVSDHGRGEEQ